MKRYRSLMALATAQVIGNVRAELARRKIQQRALARELGMSQQALSDRLSGRSRMTVDELISIARVLDVPVEQLLAAPYASPAI